jgi:hypothetical protein
MNNMRTNRSTARGGRGWRRPEPAAPAAQPAAPKSLINKHCSGFSSFSRLIDDLTMYSGMWAYAERYKGLARPPAEPAEPAGIVTSQWVKGSRLVAAPRYLLHHFTITSLRAPIPRRLRSTRRCRSRAPTPQNNVTLRALKTRPAIVYPNRALSAPAIDITVQLPGTRTVPASGFSSGAKMK